MTPSELAKRGLLPREYPLDKPLPHHVKNCNRKRKYSRRWAKIIAGRMRSQGKPVHQYQCTACKFYHIGRKRVEKSRLNQTKLFKLGSRRWANLKTWRITLTKEQDMFNFLKKKKKEDEKKPKKKPEACSDESSGVEMPDVLDIASNISDIIEITRSDDSPAVESSSSSGSSSHSLDSSSSSSYDSGSSSSYDSGSSSSSDSGSSSCSCD